MEKELKVEKPVKKKRMSYGQFVTQAGIHNLNKKEKQRLYQVYTR